MTKYISVTDTAKMLRKDLKSTFPGVKFSVRSKSYAGGASIDVHWTDGPTESQVNRVLYRYSGATFDGMRDLMEYHSSVIVDEAGNPEEVHFCANFVFGHRDYSADALRWGIVKVWEMFGGDSTPMVQYHADGDPYMTGHNIFVKNADAYYQHLVWRELQGVKGEEMVTV
jgi:hypothetical protein